MKLINCTEKKKPKFKPFSICIEFEDADEALCFKSLFNHSALCTHLSNGGIKPSAIREYINDKLYDNQKGSGRLWHSELCKLFK